MSQKRKLEVNQKPSSSGDIFRSSSIKDRASIFVAIFSPSLQARELQETPDFQSAMHRVAAWRRPSDQRSLMPSRPIYEAGHDDDGEKYAGKKLERLLVNLGVSGSVVVARWYGGILLGPVRFEHIENCAKEAIGKWQSSIGQVNAGTKRLRLDDASLRTLSGSDQTTDTDDKACKRLADTLKQRDESIAALRSLLAVKKGDEPGLHATSSPVTKVQYDAQNFNTLQKLETARDRTIAWLLKEIDKTEKDAAAVSTQTKEGHLTDALGSVESKKADATNVQESRTF